MSGEIDIQGQVQPVWDLFLGGERSLSGQINARALEASTVDLASEFTNMITTQRAYSASSKIITTAPPRVTGVSIMRSQRLSELAWRAHSSANDPGAPCSRIEMVSCTAVPGPPAIFRRRLDLH